MRFVRLLVIAALAGLLMYAAWKQIHGEQVGALFADKQQSHGEAAIGGEFTLTDQNGAVRHMADFNGKYRLVFFGFTHCMEACPVALLTLSQLMDKLGRDAERVVPLFITVDPERDTPEQMKSYLEAFHSGIVGLSGSKDALDNAAAAYKVYAARAQGEPADDNYQMNHSGYIYLMDRDGRYIQHYPHNIGVDELTDAMVRLIAADFGEGAVKQ